jgi:hypothetical protein
VTCAVFLSLLVCSRDEPHSRVLDPLNQPPKPTLAESESRTEKKSSGREVRFRPEPSNRAGGLILREVPAAVK